MPESSPPVPPSPRKKTGPKPGSPGTTTGKPWRLTEQAKKNLLAAIETGATDIAAITAARVPQRTYTGWKQKAAEGKQPYADFFADVAAAKARFEIRNVAIITEAAATRDKDGQPKDFDWKAAAWLLEHSRCTGPRWRANKPTKLEREAAKREAERHTRDMKEADTPGATNVPPVFRVDLSFPERPEPKVEPA